MRDYILAQFPENVGLTYSGEITNLELASITSLDGKFKGLEYFDEEQTKPFYTFNELRFFTGLTSLYLRLVSGYATGEFYQCHLLKYAIVPPNVIRLDGSFKDCFAIEQVDLTRVQGSGLRIGSMFEMSSAQNGLKSVTLPATRYSLNAARCFSRNVGLTTIYINGTADFSEYNTFLSMFTLCNSLTTITGNIIGISHTLDIHWSPLDHSTAVMLLNGLTTVETQQTITFSASTYATLTASEIAIATNKNWNVASA